jgi:TolB-like protein
MSAEKNQEYMSDGIAEELLNLLAQVPDLKVIARTSSFAFKGQNIDIAEIAKKLNVTHVLEGSVRTSGKQMRITAQLVRAADGTQLWSDRYDRPMDDIFAVQDEIANAVVSELRIKLLGAPPKAKQKDSRAYALFLQAREVGYLATASAFEQAISLYQQALALDPEYAEAWEGLAYVYGWQSIQGLRPSAEAFGLATEAANKALEVDPQYAQAHARLGWIAVYYDRNYELAARHLSRAMALDSSSADILLNAGILSRRLGRLEQAVDFGKRAIARDPVNSDAHFELANAFKYAKQWDAAIQQWRTVLTLSPAALGAHGSVGEVLVLQGRAESALAEIQLEADDAWRLGVKSIAHHALGQSAESAAAFAELSKKHSRLYSYTVAEVAAYRGDPNRAFEWLEKAAQLHDPSFGITPFDPFMTSLHDDPRWLPFLRKHGMAPEQLAAIKFDVKLPK